MANGSAPTSVIKLQKSLSQEAQTRLRESWKRLFQGSKNAGKLVILEDGMEYDKISFSPSELGLNASRSKTSTDLCNLFGVPEQMIDASSNTYGSVESMSIRFLQYSISPIIAIIETMFNRSLLLNEAKTKQAELANSTETTAEEMEKANKAVENATTHYNNMRRGVEQTERALDSANKELQELEIAMNRMPLDNMAKKFESLGGSLKSVSSATAPLSLALTGFGTYAVKAAMDFDQSMKNVQAVSGATSDELEALTEKAREMGATTEFTAKEAADALYYMS
jgi:methyl-accepting chemotaxis protein